MKIVIIFIAILAILFGFVFLWPYMVTQFQATVPAPVSQEPPSSDEQLPEKREKIAAYLKATEKLLADFDSYEGKSQTALKNKSLTGIAESRKDLQFIIEQRKGLTPPPELKIANQFLLEALDYERQSISLIEDGLRNRDSSKIIQAIALTDKVLESINKSKEEMRRVMLSSDFAD